MEISDLFAFIPLNGLFTTINKGLAMITISDLTTRELEIIELVLAGYTNKAIAAEIYISEKTVEFHLNHIYDKIGVRTRVLACVWAVQQGIGREFRGIPS
jgi:DNA-binding NarL/FixJ family response regulator